MAGLLYPRASEVCFPPVALPPGLEPAPTNRVPLAEVGALLVIELDGGRVHLDDDANLFARPKDAAIRDRFLAALDATGVSGWCPPLRLLHANLLAPSRDRAPGPRPDRQSAEVHRPRLGRARRRRRLVFRPQDHTPQYEVGERRHLDEERLGLVRRAHLVGPDRGVGGRPGCQRRRQRRSGRRVRRAVRGDRRWANRCGKARCRPRRRSSLPRRCRLRCRSSRASSRAWEGLHWGQGAHRHRPRALPLETRVVLVRRQKASTLWEIDNPRKSDRPLSPKAGRVHAASHP